MEIIIENYVSQICCHIGVLCCVCGGVIWSPSLINQQSHQYSHVCCCCCCGCGCWRCPSYLYSWHLANNTGTKESMRTARYDHTQNPCASSMCRRHTEFNRMRGNQKKNIKLENMLVCSCHCLMCMLKSACAIHMHLCIWFRSKCNSKGAPNARLCITG